MKKRIEVDGDKPTSDKPMADNSTNQELVDVLKTIGNDDRAKENTGTQCSC